MLHTLWEKILMIPRGYNPIEIKLYDLIIEKKEFIIPKSDARPLRSE